MKTRRALAVWCWILGGLLNGPVLPAQNGLWGEYFDNQNFTGTKVSRIDGVIDFDWLQGSPLAGIANDSFSVRWTGEIVPRFSGTYTFYATSDDGVRLWVDGQRLINGWSARLLTTDTGNIELKANKSYPIQLDYFEQTAGAVVSLAWSGAGQAFEVVPTSQLFLPLAGVNRRPNTPVVFSPQFDDLAVDPVNFQMRTDAFSDPDLNNQHSCTEWEIWSVTPLERVWSLACSPGQNLLSARLRDGVFEGSHAGRTRLLPFRQYLGRVRHRDNQATEPAWSDAVERRFNTLRSVMTLVPQGATWAFRDNSVDQGTPWRAVNFSDTTWPLGRAQFGFGDGDEVTTTCCLSGSRPMTTYFRHRFVVPDTVTITNLVVRLLRDDGGVVYLNGTEVLRSNLPQGSPILYSTAALSSASDADEMYWFHTVEVGAQLLRPGTNVVAVEVHQSSSTSSDLTFDFELLAHTVAPAPELQITRLPGRCLQLSWGETGVALEQAPSAAGPWTEVTGPLSSPALVCDPDSAQFFRLRRR